MATVEFDGIDQMMQDFDADIETLDARCLRAVDAGADVLSRYLADETRSFKDPTGEMAGLIGKPGEPVRKGSSWEQYVYPQGNYMGSRGKARRAASIAYVLEYGREGRGKIDANPWNERAEITGEPYVAMAIDDELDGG